MYFSLQFVSIETSFPAPNLSSPARLQVSVAPLYVSETEGYDPYHMSHVNALKISVSGIRNNFHYRESYAFRKCYKINKTYGMLHTLLDNIHVGVHI